MKLFLCKLNYFDVQINGSTSGLCFSAPAHQVQQLQDFQNNQDHDHLEILQISDVRETGRWGEVSNTNCMGHPWVPTVCISVLILANLCFFFWVSGNLSLAIMNCPTRSDNLLYPVLGLQVQEKLTSSVGDHISLATTWGSFFYCFSSSCCHWMRDLRGSSLPTLASVSGLGSDS